MRQRHERHETGPTARVEQRWEKNQTDGGLMDRTFIQPLQPSPGFDVHVGHGTRNMYIIC